MIASDMYVFTGTVATSSDSYSFSVTEATIGNVQCSGSEPQLEDCQYNVGVFNIGSVSRVECQYCKYKICCV